MEISKLVTWSFAIELVGTVNCYGRSVCCSRLFLSSQRILSSLPYSKYMLEIKISLVIPTILDKKTCPVALTEHFITNYVRGNI